MSGAITATVGAIAAMTTTQVFTAIAVVGGIASAVGSVTGVKELQIAGTVMGAVGGVGAIANSAGLFKSAGDLFGVGSLATEAASSAAAAPATLEGVTSAAQGAEGGAGLSSVAEAASSGVPGTAVAQNPATVQLAGTTDYMTAPVAPPSVEVKPTAGLTPPANPAPGEGYADIDALLKSGTTGASASPAVPVSGAVATPPAAGASSAGNSFGGTIAATAAGGGSEPSAWAKVFDFTKSSGGGALVSGAIQAGASFLSGATSSLTPAQVSALNAQAQANLAAANLADSNAATVQRRLQNMNSGIPTASLRQPGLINEPKQSAAPGTMANVAPPTGLINTAAPKIAVTGVPA